ncbi:hypothetical protein BU24DRAFT_404781 [Aaosphaeria arxii CBS 175.79]|uniref:Uncharacterized protein n=1 Tax=Aaosphaeria arxii CBS 175.79 TaxID=1450172 RepID=A0A6A5YB49_9PLEO|nr:uncharacterized protein BU24DRAFT_404781 [Aaosphaeria arxii CBS 175.79]KAF2021824.1 hypothetical protein BU24DRAFT_404781 [Aaosphaeria arxii CBS 175.79]
MPSFKSILLATALAASQLVAAEKFRISGQVLNGEGPASRGKMAYWSATAADGTKVCDTGKTQKDLPNKFDCDTPGATFEWKENEADATKYDITVCRKEDDCTSGQLVPTENAWQCQVFGCSGFGDIGA